MFQRTLLSSLIKWKNQRVPKRKPLILKGARQVGKTFLVEYFGKKYFEHFISLNLENPDHLRHFRLPLSLSQFERILDIEYGRTLIDGKTLLFFDEIQNSPALLNLLRFLYEERPNIHVIASGSLFEVTIRNEGLAVPVGRVEYRSLYPLDFFEFLDAIGEVRMLQALKTMGKNDALPPSIHDHANELFARYMIIGGMPEIVAAHVSARSFLAVRELSSSLLGAFADDVYKYASHANARYIQHLIDRVPFYAGTTTSYEKLGEGSYHSREISRACDILEHARVMTAIPATTSRMLPLIAKLKMPKKYLFIDTGLVAYRSDIQDDMPARSLLLDSFRGRFAEQVVGQHLLMFVGDNQLFYWTRKKTEGRAEIDFCFAHKGRAIGVEVKSGKPRTLRSLLSFADLVPESRLVRISTAPLLEEMVSYQSKTYQLLSLPFYLLPRLDEFLISSSGQKQVY